MVYRFLAWKVFLLTGLLVSPLQTGNPFWGKIYSGLVERGAWGL